MADACMPEKYYELAAPMLPAEKEIGPQGGRPRITHRAVLKVIWFVLVTGCRWKDVPRELGCCGETARMRLQVWERVGIWDQLHRVLLSMLNHEKQLDLETAIIDSTQVRAFGGGDLTGAESSRSPQKRDEIFAAGRLPRRSTGDPHGSCQFERPLRDSADGNGLSPNWRQAGASPHASEETLCRRGLRLRGHAEHSPLVGNRASHSVPRRRTWKSPGSDALGRGTHHQLDQRSAPHAYPL